MYQVGLFYRNFVTLIKTACNAFWEYFLAHFLAASWLVHTQAQIKKKGRRREVIFSHCVSVTKTLTQRCIKPHPLFNCTHSTRIGAQAPIEAHWRSSRSTTTIHNNNIDNRRLIFYTKISVNSLHLRK